MGSTLRKRLKQDRFESPEQEALLNLLIAANYIRQEFHSLCVRYGVTMGQYNVLRILKGAHPEGYARYEIIARMIEPAPDVTRLIEKLEQQELVIRTQSEEDRRVMITTITRKGLTLLETMHPAVLEFDNHFKKYLSTAEIEQLSELCEKLYAHRAFGGCGFAAP